MKNLVLICFIWLLPLTLLAQTKVSGTVTDDKGQPVPFANVFIKDSYDGASTDEKGKFSFDTEETGDQILSVSFVGFENFEQAIKLEGKPIEMNPVLKTSAEQLDPVVITAGSFEASDEKKAVILSSLDIVTTAGADGDVYGALNTLPGTQQVGEEEGLFVRGGSAAETKTIIDEMVVQNPFFSSVPDVPQRGRFSPFLFKGTIFSTGGYSAVYGQALSSALILNTTDVETKTNTGIGILPVGLMLSHTHAWEKSSMSANGSYTNLGPYFKVIPQLTEWDQEPTSVGGSFVYRTKTSKTGMFKMYTSYNQSSLSMYFDDINVPDGKTRFEMDNQNIYVNSSYKEILNDKWSIFTGMSYSDNSNDILQADVFDLSSTEKLGQGKVILTHSLSEYSTIKFGGEIHQLNLDGAFNGFSSEVKELYTAGFAETDFLITKKLAFKIGGRFENSEVLGSQNIAPRASTAYKTGDKSQISLAYGHFYQTPETQFLFQAEGFGDNLEYENATHYIGNWQWMNDGYTFRVEFYDKEYNNLIKYQADSTLGNNGSGYARGFDIFWRDKKTFKYTDYWISYSYLDTKRDYRWYPIEAAPTFTSKHTLSVVYKRWFAKLKSSLSGTFTYGSGRPYYNPNKPDSEFHSDLTDDYINLSLSASYLTNIAGNFTVVFASINNVFGRGNVYGYRYSASGDNRVAVGPPSLRTVFVGVFISIDHIKKSKDPEKTETDE